MADPIEARGSHVNRYDSSVVHPTTIGVGGQSTGRFDMGRQYAFYRLRILNCVALAAGTAITLQVAPTPTHQLCDLYETNTPVTRWSQGDLPVTDSIDFELTHAMNCSSFNIQLSVGAVGTVSFEIFGSDSAL